MAEATIAKAYVQLIPTTKGFQGNLESELGGSLGSSGETLGSSWGGKFASFAIKAIAAAGIGKAISDSISNAAEFETSMAKASTLFSGTTDELAALQDDILGLSSTYGVAAAELAEAAYSAESASVPMENLSGMLEASSQLAVAGFTDIDTALSATAKTMNAYGMMSEDAAETQANLEAVQRVLIQTQNKGITTVGELGASLSQVTPTASAFGVSFDQVGAAIAGMTAQGTKTAQATTQLNSLIAELGKDGTKASDTFRELTSYVQEGGLSFAEAMEQGWDLSDVLRVFDEECQETGASMVDMFSSIEAGKAALSIWNSDWTGNMEAMGTEADVVGEAYSKMADTFQTKSSIMKESLKNLGMGLVTDLMGSLGTGMDFLNEQLGLLQTALADGGISGMFTTLAMEVIPNFIAGLQEGMESFTQAGIDMMTNLAAGVVTGIPEFLAQALPMLVEFTGNLKSNVGQLVDAGIELVKSIVQGIINGFPVLIANVPQIIINIADIINENMPKILKAGLDIIIMLGKGIIENIPVIIANAGKIIEAIVAVFQAMNWLDLGAKLMKLIGSGIKNMISFVVNFAKEFVKSFGQSIKTFDWLGLGKSIVTGLINGVKAMAGGFKNIIIDMAKSAFDGIKSFFGIGSPSKLMRDEIGKWIPAGIAIGVEENMSPLTDAMEDIAKEASGSYFSDVVMNAASGEKYSSPETGSAVNYGGVVINVTAQDVRQSQDFVDWLENQLTKRQYSRMATGMA